MMNRDTPKALAEKFRYLTLQWRGGAGRSITFVVLLFAASGPFYALSFSNSWRLLPGLPVGALVTVLPGALALFLVRVATGNLPQTLRALVPCRRSSPGVLLLALLPAIIVLGASLVEAPGAWGLAGFTPREASLVVSALLLAATLEEIGWTSFLAHRMLPGWGVATTGLTIGAIAALWHLPLLVAVGHDGVWIGCWILNSVALRCIIVELYVRGFSLMPPILAHAGYNAAWQFGPDGVDGFNAWLAGLLLASTWVAVRLFRIVWATGSLRAISR